MQTKIIKNLGEMKIFADFFIKNLPKIANQATIIGLFGDLGSGKTAFVQAIAQILGVSEYITSPTFVIQKKYKINSSKNTFENLIHIDAYRLDSSEELLNLGWQEIASNPKNIIFIEWPEKIKEILPPDAIELFFKFIDEQTREIKSKIQPLHNI